MTCHADSCFCFVLRSLCSVCVCWYNETCAPTLSSLEVWGLNYHCKEKIPEVFNIVLSNLLIKKSTSAIQMASAGPLVSCLRVVLPSLLTYNHIWNVGDGFFIHKLFPHSSKLPKIPMEIIFLLLRINFSEAIPEQRNQFNIRAFNCMKSIRLYSSTDKNETKVKE